VIVPIRSAVVLVLVSLASRRTTRHRKDGGTTQTETVPVVIKATCVHY
jgi:hypothetical protein